MAIPGRQRGLVLPKKTEQSHPALQKQKLSVLENGSGKVPQPTPHRAHMRMAREVTNQPGGQCHGHQWLNKEVPQAGKVPGQWTAHTALAEDPPGFDSQHPQQATYN